MENKDMYKEAQLETINSYIEKDFDDDPNFRDDD